MKAVFKLEVGVFDAVRANITRVFVFLSATERATAITALKKSQFVKRRTIFLNLLDPGNESAPESPEETLSIVKNWVGSNERNGLLKKSARRAV